MISIEDELQEFMFSGTANPQNYFYGSITECNQGIASAGKTADIRQAADKGYH